LGSVKSRSYVKATSVRFSASFEDAMKPGATWSFEVESDMATQSKTSLLSRDKQQHVVEKLSCSNGDRADASTLGPRLTGKMIPMTCVSTGIGDEKRMKMAFLEDSAMFVSLGIETAKTINEMRVESWE